MQFLKILLLIAIIYSCSNEVNEIEHNSIEKSVSAKDKEDSIELKNNVQYNTVIDTVYYTPEWNEKKIKGKYEEGQGLLKGYVDYIDPLKMDSIIITLEDNNKSEIRYLGKVEMLESGEVFHVLTSFTILGIDVMPSPRGNSKIIFISKNLNKCLYYTVMMPNELPFKIDDNQLCFKHDTTKIRVSISEGLPLILCIAIIGCKE